MLKNLSVLLGGYFDDKGTDETGQIK